MSSRLSVLKIGANYTHSLSALSKRTMSVVIPQSEKSALFDSQYSENYLNEASIYIHWPFCSKRCYFCNFNKYIEKNVNNVMMRNCLVKETEYLLIESGIKNVISVFFGGGTPNLAEPETIQAVLRTILNHANVSNETEITMEVNPFKKCPHRLEDYKNVGINRVSVGVQALSDRSLQELGRDHSVEDALGTLREAIILFPNRTSVDILFGLPNQSLECWNETLEMLIPLLDDHVSVYQLTLERGTKLFKMYEQGLISIPDENVISDMFNLASFKLRSSGFHQYEISNFSRSTEACSIHNQAYWFGKQYIGIGPGAHSRFVPKTLYEPRGMREARIQTLEPVPWMKEVQAVGHGTRLMRKQTKREVLEEVLSTGLRTAEGVTNRIWKDLYPQGITALCEHFSESPTTKWLFQNGYLTSTSGCIRATWKGWKVLDHILPYLLIELNRVLSGKGL
ncbi:hypothetical protein J437_LFUL013886 [Ladona fulva]|uniref:Radical S-adenosyl methionine domain-containing protein 1, mitochondrial n=1 Tax=Ladona fulva TaxID=123851 RepID=A0A8K0KSP9_LADFU|nr:hypothetical protein J437_LFUL013886 [Ladona fulva]